MESPRVITTRGLYVEFRLERRYSSSFLQGLGGWDAVPFAPLLQGHPAVTPDATAFSLLRCGVAARVRHADVASGGYSRPRPRCRSVCRCAVRKRHRGTLSGARPQRQQGSAERPARAEFPCRSVGRCAPAVFLGPGERNEGELCLLASATKAQSQAGSEVGLVLVRDLHGHAVEA